MREDEIVAELESIRMLLRSSQPKVQNAEHRLKLLVRRIVEGK